MADVITNNFRGDELNRRLYYPMVRLQNVQKTCAIGVIRDQRVRGTRCYDDLTGLS